MSAARAVLAAALILTPAPVPGGVPEPRSPLEVAVQKALPSGWQLGIAPAPLAVLALGPDTEAGRMVVGVRKIDDPPGTVELFSETGRKELSAAVEARAGVLDVTGVVASPLSGVPEISASLRGPVSDAFEIRYLLLPSRPALLVTLAGPRSKFAGARVSVEKRIVAALLEVQARTKN
ncbi:MAG: hypothetical protein HY791_27940 [Deltaproteobacteria bacterium]|nr:hypothetical protein [Deltaproteobacteria bacterium]